MPTPEWRRENPDKVRAARRRWYERNRQRQISRQRERKQEMMAWFIELKSQLKCSTPGCNQDHVGCLEFHHDDPKKKEGEISRLIRVRGWSKERVLEEIKKCTVLCANCHRILHWEERHSKEE